LQHYATLRELQHDLHHGHLTCPQVVQHYLEKLHHAQHLNAFLSVYAEEALGHAHRIQSKISEGTAGRLAGLVVGLKDVFSHTGHPLQAASRILQGFEAQYNATAVQRLLNEDAIIIGRQNCDEFGMGSATENSAFGASVHPLDGTRVPGGSSGGSAAAVKAGLCRISLGSDTGGSVRQPAAFCGVIGLKPTYGRVSRHGLVAYASSFDCVGILGTHVEDVALVLEVIAGNDAHDSTTSRHPVPAYTTYLSAEIEKPYRIAVVSPAEGVQPEIRNALEQAMEGLQRQGHQLETVTIPLQEYVLPAYYILATAEASSNLSRYDGVRYGYRSTQADKLESLYKKTRTEGLGTEVKRRILLGTFVLSSDYHDAYYRQAQKVRRLIRDKTNEILHRYDFIMTPATPTTAFPRGQSGKNPVQDYLADVFSVQANLCGIPGISLPWGADANGLPIGIQVMGRAFEEEKLLRFSDVLLSAHR
jgi:aspartyl-tRNA(Asn)/glutamyl-tRNA(Gln) amidotransferase subunit A